MIYCPDCGSEVPSNAKFCPGCGLQRSTPERSPRGRPIQQKGSGFGVAALVLGIVGFLIGPAAVLAIIFGAIGVGRNRRGRGMAWAGLIMGIVAIGLTILLWALIGSAFLFM